MGLKGNGSFKGSRERVDRKMVPVEQKRCPEDMFRLLRYEVCSLNENRKAFNNPVLAIGRANVFGWIDTMDGQYSDLSVRESPCSHDRRPADLSE